MSYRIFLATFCFKCRLNYSYKQICLLYNIFHHRLGEFLHSFETGELLFCEFECLLGQIFAEDYSGLAEELKTLDIVDKVIKVKIDQLKKYRRLETCRNGAIAFLKFKQAYQLTGDFRQLTYIAEVSFLSIKGITHLFCLLLNKFCRYKTR